MKFTVWERDIVRFLTLFLPSLWIVLTTIDTVDYHYRLSFSDLQYITFRQYIAMYVVLSCNVYQKDVS